MTADSPEFRELVRGRWSRFTSGNPPDPLGVAVLGPNSGMNDFGSSKSHQIKNELVNEGHNAFCLEDIIEIDPQLSVIDQEPELLTRVEVDLIIILHTDDSPYVENQIYSFTSNPVLVAKTAILYPRELFDTHADFVEYTVREFPIVKPYDDEAFKSCSVVAECRYMVATRELQGWENFRFMRI